MTPNSPVPPAGSVATWPEPSFDIEALRQALERQVQGEVRFDDVSRALYSTDASVYQVLPLGVVVPRTAADVAATVRACAAVGCPVTMRGGGTAQGGQSIGPGVVVDTSKHLTRILELNAEERWVRVEPGIVLDVLNEQLKPRKLRFAPDISTASRATIGGMMANNSSGARSVYYGKTIDHVLEQEVLLTDGSIVQWGPRPASELDALASADTLEGRCYQVVRRLAAEHADEIARRFPKILRRVGGYNLDAFVPPFDGEAVPSADWPFNLAKLMVGSEGTLGVVLSAKLKLVPLPHAKAVVAIHFADLLDSLAATPVILQHGPSAVEVMDRFILDFTKQSPALHAVRETFIQGDPGALLCVEFYADDADELPDRLRRLEEDLRRRGFGYHFHHALAPEAQARIWKVRESALGLSMAMKDDAKSLSFVEDTAVAPERLRDYIERFLQIVARHGTRTGLYAHASVGCLHVRPVVNLKTEEGVRQFEAIANDVADLVLEFGGALSGEHGDGFVRSPFMAKMYGPVLYEAFREIKRTFDPDGILNPGKIVDAPPLTANLRYGPAYRAVDPATYFDYGDYGGLAGAVEMCSGVGACRKVLDGTMCPSYMATREEAHSTRGRANVLRLTMAGRLGEAGLGDRGVYDVLDLCLECRACKAECPVGVDVARFKSEFLADYWTRHGLPSSARVLGQVGTVAPWGSRLAPLANWLGRNRTARRWAERWLGVDRRRRLPVFARRTLRDRVSMVSAPDAVLFADTFTNHYEPAIGTAAIEVLRAAGVAAGVVPHGCCGRPQISKGLLDRARQLARRNVQALHAHALAGLPIVVLEPSCLSALREDAPALLRGEEQQRAEAVGAACVLFEDYVNGLVEAGAALPLRAGPRTILLHGHCHQKAMGLLGPAETLLARVPDAQVVDLDAGCCGMAGSFGYTADHYEVSCQMAERRLVPAIRGMDADSVLVAGGTSCRHQVHDLTGEVARHPAELLAALLTDRNSRPDNRSREFDR